jgi:hypothetical protein
MKVMTRIILHTTLYTVLLNGSLVLATDEGTMTTNKAISSYTARIETPIPRATETRNAATITNLTEVQMDTVKAGPESITDDPIPTREQALIQQPLRSMTDEQLEAIDGGINLTLAVVAAAVSSGLRSLGADDAADVAADIGRQLTGPAGRTIHDLGTAAGIPGSVR